MMREGREHSHRHGMGNDRLHGVRVSGKSAQQDQHDSGRPGFLHDIAVFSRIVPVSDTHRQAVECQFRKRKGIQKPKEVEQSTTFFPATNLGRRVFRPQFCRRLPVQESSTTDLAVLILDFSSYWVYI
jgi:hypothetical protein